MIRRRCPRLFALAAAMSLLVPMAPPAGAFTYGNLVITRGNDVVEYRPDGIPVRVIPVPYPPGARGPDEPLGGIMFDSDARLAVYNGADHPWLSVYDAATDAWTHTTWSSWSTLTNPGLAGLATSGRDVFVTDMGTLDGPERGVVGFDGEAGYAGERFGTLFNTADLAVGPDGRIHALLAFSAEVYIYDPVSKQEVGNAGLEGSVSAIAVREDGAYYGVSGEGHVRLFTPGGISVDTLKTAVPGLIDVAIGPDGTLLMGSALGEVVLADSALGQATTFLVGGGPASVAWVPLHASTPASKNTWGRLKARYRR